MAASQGSWGRWGTVAQPCRGGTDAVPCSQWQPTALAKLQPWWVLHGPGPGVALAAAGVLVPTGGHVPAALVGVNGFLSHAADLILVSFA